jgi:hypothetical protein
VPSSGIGEVGCPHPGADSFAYTNRITSIAKILLTCPVVSSIVRAMDDTERLVALEAIKRLKGRYFRCLDTKRWPEYRACFTDDCEFSRTAVSAAGGPDAFVANLAEILANVSTVHHGHTPEIELLTPRTARGIWAMVDHLRWAPDADIPEFMRADPRQTGLSGYGHYEEEYRFEDGRWKISLFRVTRLNLVPLVEEQIPLEGAWSPTTRDWLPAAG